MTAGPAAAHVRRGFERTGRRDLTRSRRPD